MTTLPQTVRLTLPVTTSLNVLNGIRHGKWGAEKYKKHRDSLEGIVWAELVTTGQKHLIPWPPATRQRSARNNDRAPRMTTLRATRYGTRKLDRINLWGGFKALVDVLTRLGLIFDDSEQWLDDDYKQEKANRGESRTELEISWLSGTQGG